MASRTGFDVHQEITNRIVDAIETAGEFCLPWVSGHSGKLGRPVNIATRKAYNGVNILTLWISSLASGYTSNIWGTYRQWQAQGCQVRRNEKSSLVVFYKPVVLDDSDEDGDTKRERVISRATYVFNAAQVDGFSAIPEESVPGVPLFDPIERAERFVKATGARVEEGGDTACFQASADVILMPDRCRFTGSDVSSPAEAFYATLCHELTHWSGAKGRLDRNLSGRFGSKSYAMEELIAELGSAFLCAELGISRELRQDHARYVKTWLGVLKSDKKAVFTAAAKASEAANWLLAWQEEDD